VFFPCQCYSTVALHSCISSRGMNSMPIGGCWLETLSHPIDMSKKKLSAITWNYLCIFNMQKNLSSWIIFWTLSIVNFFQAQSFRNWMFSHPCVKLWWGINPSVFGLLDRAIFSPFVTDRA
jgi:hypothetical protein